MAGLDMTRQFIALGIAVLTVSDSRDEADDRSGGYLCDAVRAAGHNLVGRRIVRDEIATITSCLDEWLADAAIDVVISTGGTGLTGRDVTVEAFRSRFHKELDGFAALWHQIGFVSVGQSTIQSRACAGLAEATYMFCLPGSPGACRDGWEQILLHQLDHRFRPCNLVEILPRLQET